MCRILLPTVAQRAYSRRRRRGSPALAILRRSGIPVTQLPTPRGFGRFPFQTLAMEQGFKFKLPFDCPPLPPLLRCYSVLLVGDCSVGRPRVVTTHWSMEGSTTFTASVALQATTTLVRTVHRAIRLESLVHGFGSVKQMVNDWQNHPYKLQ